MVSFLAALTYLQFCRKYLFVGIGSWSVSGRVETEISVFHLVLLNNKCYWMSKVG